MNNDNFKNLIIIVLILTNLYTLNLIFKKSPKENVSNETNQVEFRVDEKFSNINNPDVIKYSASIEMDKDFYQRLQNCTQSELATNTAHEYTIYGIESGFLNGVERSFCHFQERMDYYVLDCLLPMDMTKKYAEEGLQEFKELEELKRSNKSGMIQSSNYINEINNNKEYCTHANTAKK